MGGKAIQRGRRTGYAIMDTLEPRRLLSAKFIGGGGALLNGGGGASRGVNQYVGAAATPQSLGTLNPGAERMGRGEVHGSGYRTFTFTLAKPVTTTVTLNAASDHVRATLVGPDGKTISTMSARQETMATPLEAGRYTLRVFGGSSLWPDGFHVKVRAAQAVSPTRIDAIAWGGNSANVRWIDNIGEDGWQEMGYRVDLRDTDDGQWVKGAVVGRNHTAAIIENLKPGKHYQFRVSAVVQSATTGWGLAQSPTIVATTMGAQNTSGYYKVTDIDYQGKGSAGWNLTTEGLSITDTGWIQAGSWQAAVAKAVSGTTVVMRTFGPMSGQPLSHAFAKPNGDLQSGSFMINTGDEVHSQRLGSAIPNNANLKVIGLEDSYNQSSSTTEVDDDHDDFWWTVETDYRPAVESVSWIPLDSPLTPNSHPSGTVGLRIFPDKQSLTDNLNRRKVMVRAKLEQPAEGVQVFFRIFDPDDPSTDDAPIDPNGTNGGDNRGNDSLGTTSVVTDANGLAEVTFTIGRRAGDNYRIAATTIEESLSELNNNNVTPDTSQVSDFEGKLTPLLTVWRKLYIESDYMQAPPQVLANGHQGEIGTASLTNIGGQTFTKLSIEDVPAHFEFDHQFEDGGFIIIDGIGKLNVHSFFSKVFWDDLYVAGNYTSTGTFDATGRSFELFDDDMEYLGSGQVQFKASFGRANTSMLADGFAPAYFEPVIISNTSSNIPFDPNLLVSGLTDEETDVIYADRQYAVSDASDDFIVVHLVQAFQPTYAKDGDAHDEEIVFGVAQVEDLGAIVFAETLREGAPLFDTPLVEWNTLHELGHLFAPAEVDDHLDGGVMTGPVLPQGHPQAFSDISLDRIRSKSSW